jgi:hypothetical protein
MLAPQDDAAVNVLPDSAHGGSTSNDGRHQAQLLEDARLSLCIEVLLYAMKPKSAAAKRERFGNAEVISAGAKPNHFAIVAAY